MYKLIGIVGPTAGGKTSLAVHLALKVNGEIISADSRQVYKGMDIGTGKDLDDYTVNGVSIPFHLIDIHEPGEKYNVFEFQKDFYKVLAKITESKKTPILCGGTGLYIDSVVNQYKLIAVPQNIELREKLSQKTLEELEVILSGYKKMHNKSDLDTTKRAIRAIEIEEYQKNNNLKFDPKPEINSLLIGVRYTREQQRVNITRRLKDRLENGMIHEVEGLVANGVSFEDLEYYGLEYKYIALYLQNRLNYQELFEKLNTAIHQFGKRQVTWFRKMEKEGVKINWIEGELPLAEKLDEAYKMVVKHGFVS